MAISLQCWASYLLKVTSTYYLQLNYLVTVSVGSNALLM